MKVIHAANELQLAGQKVCLAIGFFDGVHLGHQQIIRQTVADARQHEAVAVAVTFDNHPNTVVAPDRAPLLIYSLPQKIRALESLGVDVLLLIHFDKAFSEQTGEEFVGCLAREFSGLKSLCVGADFTFGYRRSGNVALLKELGQKFNFTVHGMAAVSLDGNVVSSTRIREAVRTGNLDAASQMLGRAYSLAGQVVKGDRLGHELGFPTANLDAAGLVLPPVGVYAVHATVCGQTHRAILNIGRRPTLESPNPQLRVEAHLLNFQGELYGEEMEIALVAKLRDEKRFASLAELKAQIARDLLDAGSRF
ncbi:MAG TPA: bifunctional riboflavin kinase/FAD synthetase [Verrucomicrobiae bacterium]|nr:bifunctional riboflavin kinase/FAD synthetase [Verrucomicrobiae bacterium]